MEKIRNNKLRSFIGILFCTIMGFLFSTFVLIGDVVKPEVLADMIIILFFVIIIFLIRSFSNRDNGVFCSKEGLVFIHGNSKNMFNWDDIQIKTVDYFFKNLNLKVVVIKSI